MNSPTNLQGPSLYSEPQIRGLAAMAHAGAAFAAATSIHGHAPPTTRVPERTNMEVESFGAEPPKHTRPLYWSIPLPDNDDPYDSAGPSYSVPSHSNTVSQATGFHLAVGNGWTSSLQYPSGHFLIRQEPGHALQRANEAHPPTAGAVYAEIHVALAPYIGAHDHDRNRRGGYGYGVTRMELLEPATNPPVQHLTVVSVVGGFTLEVHGRLAEEGYGAVLVSDALDAIETLKDRVGRRVISGGQSLLLGRSDSYAQLGLHIGRRFSGMAGVMVVAVS